jgi:DNA-binding CsgD family transcriptional regulator/tetratricopeptide (TPR) repeat protein
MAPAARTRAASPVLAGRAEEFAGLCRVGERVRAGQPQVVVVAGRAGLGKTRLVEEAAGSWRRGGLRVLVGTCPAVQGTPMAPLRTAFDGLVAGARLGHLLSGEEVVGRTVLFEEVAGAIGGLAGGKGVVLVVEDLHWSDRATRSALAYVAGRLGPGRWGLVVTHRPEGPLTPSEAASFTDSLARWPTTMVTLEGLSIADVADQVAGITGSPTTDEVALDVHRRTGGIPLLVEEVVAARFRGVPEHVRSKLLSRVAGTDVVFRDVLDVIAVAGETDELLVAEVLDDEVGRVAARLSAACDEDIVVVDRSGYRLRHDLLREAVLDTVAPGRRRVLHGRVAAALADRRSADAAVLAEHWAQAGELDHAAVASLRAARHAQLLHAPASVLRHLSRVIETWSDLDSECRAQCGPLDGLLGRAAAAAEGCGEYATAVALAQQRLDAVRPLDGATGAEQPGGGVSGSDAALRWERLGRYRWENGDGAGAHAAYTEAARILPDSASDAVRAQVLSGLAWHFAASYRDEDARRVASQARSAVPGVEDLLIRWQVYLAAGIAWAGTAAGHSDLVESIRLATARSAEREMAISRLWLDICDEDRMTCAEREANLQAALRSASVDGSGGFVAAVRYRLGALFIDLGRWDEASELLEQNLRVCGPDVACLFTWAYRSRLAGLRGDGERLEESLARTRSLSERIPQQPMPLAIAMTAQACLRTWTSPAVAVATAREALDLSVVDAGTQAESVTVLAGAEAALSRSLAGRRPPTPGSDALRGGSDAADLAQLVRAVEASSGDGTRRAACARTCRAELAEIDGRPQAGLWRSAITAWAARGDPYAEAYARWRLAALLVRDRSTRQEAATHLGWSHDATTRLRARPLAGAIEALATRARLPLRDAAARASHAGGNPAALTAREMDVLPLLAAGRTNEEIAQTLVISPRTVGVHVSRILHKLAVGRRGEVGDAARRAGLLDG